MPHTNEQAGALCSENPSLAGIDSVAAKEGGAEFRIPAVQVYERASAYVALLRSPKNMLFALRFDLCLASQF
jgi:hypothetical protein